MPAVPPAAARLASHLKPLRTAGGSEESRGDLSSSYPHFQISERKNYSMIHQFIFLRLRRASLLRMTLLSTALLDELIIGFIVVGLPLVRDQLGLSYAQVGLLFSVGPLSGMILDPIFNLLSDRGSKRWWIIGGLLALTAGFALAGSTRSFVLLLVAYALICPADGAGVGLPQAVLIDNAPNDTARTMTRWTLMSSIGDLLSPLVVAAIVALGMGWTMLCWLAAGLCLATALVLWFQRFPRTTSTEDGEEHIGVREIFTGLRKALRDPLLLRWGTISLITSMLDEVFLGFAALYLHDVLHASEAIIGVVLTFHLIGGLVGLIILDRLIGRIAPARLLIWMTLLALVGIIGFLIIRSIWLSALALFVIDLGAVCWYPIAESAAYARLPGRSGTVRTVIGLGAPFEVVLPGIVGLIAGSFGVLAGVGLLGLAPLLVLLLVPRQKG